MAAIYFGTNFVGVGKTILLGGCRTKMICESCSIWMKKWASQLYSNSQTCLPGPPGSKRTREVSNNEPLLEVTVPNVNQNSHPKPIKKLCPDINSWEVWKVHASRYPAMLSKHFTNKPYYFMGKIVGMDKPDNLTWGQRGRQSKTSVKAFHHYRTIMIIGFRIWAFKYDFFNLGSIRKATFYRNIALSYQMKWDPGGAVG